MLYVVNLVNFDDPKVTWTFLYRRTSHTPSRVNTSGATLATYIKAKYREWSVGFRVNCDSEADINSRMAAVLPSCLAFSMLTERSPIKIFWLEK